MAFRIRNKLLIAFGAILLPFAILTIINHYHQKTIYSATHEVHTIAEEIQKVSEIQLSLHRINMTANDYIITGDKKYLDDFNREWAGMENIFKDLKRMELSLSDKYAHHKLKEEIEILNDVEVLLKNIRELSLKIFEIPNPVGNRDAMRLMEELDYKWVYPSVKKLEKYHEIEREDYTDAISVSDRAWKMSWLIRIIGSIIVISISIFFAFFYSKLFVLPIKQVHNGADAIAKGDFKVRLDIKTGDEIEQLSNTMNEMAKQLDMLYHNMSEKIEDGIKKFSAIAESANDAIVVLASPDIILFWNKKAEEIFGYKADEVIGKSVHELIVPHKSRERARVGLEFFLKTGEGPIIGKVAEDIALRKDGTEFPIEHSVSAIKIGNEWQAVGIIRDIMERKKSEEKLKHQIDELEQFRKITIKRELRMEELKKRVRELEGKLGIV